MRVLVCSSTYPPEHDGISRAAFTMAEGLARRGHAVEVATTFLPARALDPERSKTVTVREFRVSGHRTRQGVYEGEIDAFHNWLLAADFDVVFCHGWYVWPTDLVISVVPQLAARKVLVSHGFGAHRVEWHNRFPWGLGVWTRWLPYVWRLPEKLRAFDWCLFLSARADFGRFFDQWVARRSGYLQCSVIPNSVTPKPLARAGLFRKTYGLGESFVFLCVANYSSRKNQELAVRAFHAAGLPTATLVFIGSELGEYGRAVQTIAAQLETTPGVPRILLLEKISQELTDAAFVDCDVFVLPAKAETQPIVLLEAMAVGKPFISTNTGCVSDLPGGLVVQGAAGMANAMQKLAGDSALRATLSAAASRAAREDYAEERMLDAEEALLRKLVPQPS